MVLVLHRESFSFRLSEALVELIKSAYIFLDYCTYKYFLLIGTCQGKFGMSADWVSKICYFPLRAKKWQYFGTFIQFWNCRHLQGSPEQLDNTGSSWKVLRISSWCQQSPETSAGPFKAQGHRPSQSSLLVSA